MANGKGVSEGLPIRELAELIGPADLKMMLEECSIGDLRRYVNEIAGQPPHPGVTREFIVASLVRWIDGDENWGDEPNRVNHLKGRKKSKVNSNSTQDAPAETPGAEEDDMNTQKAAVSHSGEKKASKKSVPPKVKAEKAEKKARTLPTGKTSGETRATYILNLLIANRKEKHSDAELLAKAQKEFSAELVPGPSGTFTIAHQRGVANKDRVEGRRGLKKTDPEFVEYGKPEKEKGNGKK